MSASQQQTAVTLAPMTFPLHGMRLIEASAGTGKTYTITGLYLRLLLGHGDAGSRHQRMLRVEDILVVTFTEAATAELRGRIRDRIHQARLAFSRSYCDDSDLVLSQLLKDIPNHAAAAQVLLQAEREIDLAAIYTIHGFCQRMLIQHAFESGSSFQYELKADESHLKAQVIADYWRRHFYPLPRTLAMEVMRLWPTPDALAARIGRYLSGPIPTFSVPCMTDELTALHAQNVQAIERLKQAWLTDVDEYEALISASGVHKRSYTKKTLPNWVAEVTDWAKKETQDYALPKNLYRFSQQVLNDSAAKGNPPIHPIFEQIQAILDTPISLEGPLVTHAIAACRRGLQQAKTDHQWVSFDDLLANLSAALSGASADVLAERIRSVYPMAMIDEFQDTDPLQYDIFSRVYAAHETSGLLMIGDPKQAIYAFRGADIFTYIKARRQVQSHFTLETNWRSSQAMVDAVNQVFGYGEAPFLYDDDIPFRPVAAAPNADTMRWTLGGETQSAMTMWWPETETALVKKETYETLMADATAAQIQTILTLAQQGQATLGKGEAQHPIQANQIAVLVRTGREGKRVQKALAQQGIASVYLSNRDSVFSSPIAHDMARLMAAVLHPENERKLRACLASPLFQCALSDLDVLKADDELWESIVLEFQTYRQRWTQRGILPMLRAVLVKRQFAERWLQHLQGERMLTDYLHLGELLQHASSSVESEHGLLRWFFESIESAALGQQAGEDAIQRLESEQEVVQIITIHKSKGLEYDLVFLPFAMSYREAKEAKYYDHERDCVVVDVYGSKTALTQAEYERLAEDLRLLYVALTRSVYGCLIGIAPLGSGKKLSGPSQAHRSAIGYLLRQTEDSDAAQLLHHATTLAAQCTSCVLASPPLLPEAPFVPDQAILDELPLHVMQRSIARHWRVMSYSSLTQDIGHSSSKSHVLPECEPVGFDSDSLGEHVQAQASWDELTAPPAMSMFTFPRGATAGTFLHRVFEKITFTASVDAPLNTQVIQQEMDMARVDMMWLPILKQMVTQVLQTPLDGKTLCLNQIPSSRCLIEMAFMFPMHLLQAAELNRLVKKYNPLSAKASDLRFSQVEGMLKGFIDLVFEWQGRYYILDWKSNHLGDCVTDYHPEQLEAAMVAHRYDLQYQLYTVALHRFLSTRLPDYDYETHIGGVYYVFLRGVGGEQRPPQGQYGIFATRPSRDCIMALDQLFQGHALEHIIAEARKPDSGQMELDLS